MGNIVWAIITYVFLAMGMYAVSKRRGIPFSWFAWIPVLNVYNIGLVAEEYTDRIEKRRVNCKFKLTVLVIAAIVCEIILSSIPGEDYLASALFKNGVIDFSAVMGILIVAIGAIVVSVLFIVWYLIALNRIFKWCTRHSTVFTVLSAVTLGALAPFFIFAVRNKVSDLITEKSNF